MMPGIDSTIHVAPETWGWAVRREGEVDAQSVYADRDSAVRYGSELARSRRGCLVVHRSDGSVSAEHRY